MEWLALFVKLTTYFSTLVQVEYKFLNQLFQFSIQPFSYIYIYVPLIKIMLNETSNTCTSIIVYQCTYIAAFPAGGGSYCSGQNALWKNSKGTNMAGSYIWAYIGEPFANATVYLLHIVFYKSYFCCYTFGLGAWFPKYVGYYNISKCIVEFDSDYIEGYRKTPRLNSQSSLHLA